MKKIYIGVYVKCPIYIGLYVKCPICIGLYVKCPIYIGLYVKCPIYIGLYVKCPISCHILMKLEFFRQFFEKYSNIKFHENPSIGSRFVPFGLIEGQT